MSKSKKRNKIKEENMKKFLLMIVILFITAFAAILSIETFQLTASVISASATTTATVTVLPAYRLSEDINVLSCSVTQGSNLLFTVDLKKTDLVKGLSNKIYVDLNYQILKGNKVVKSGFLKTVSLSKCYRETLSILIPKDFSTGSYTLVVNATNGQSYSASDKDTFTVKRK